MAETLLQLQNASLFFGARCIFSDASFSVNEGEHLGVIGPNGAGKSTLFRVLLDQEPLQQGQVIRSKKLRIAHLSQHDHWQEGETGADYLERQAPMPLWEMKSLAPSLRLDPESFDRPILSWSGGYRMRFKLLALLGQEPNLMLLDEPTNYLDLETVLVLEEFLQNYSGAFLLISHDREFLRRTTDHTLEVEAGEITKYNGNIDDYFEQKSLLRSQLESAAKSQESKRKEILDFVARFGAKATKAKQAQSRLKQLDKMEAIELKPITQLSAIKIPKPPHVGKVAFRVEGVSLGYEQKSVLSNVNFAVERGDHIAVVGWNGAGKSTLLKALAGELVPLVGQIQVGQGVRVSYFAQHVAESLKAEDSVYESMDSVTDSGTPPQTILDIAGSLQFSGDDVRKLVRMLSGGEKSRVALGQILLKGSPCLVLDEPTNHLDFMTVEALTQALNQYEGTVILVSHDRGFVKRVAKKILEVDGGKVRFYPGSYDDYVWSVQQRDRSKEKATRGKKGLNLASLGPNPDQPSKTEKLSNRREEKKDLEREQKQLKKRIEKAEAEISSCRQSIEKCNESLQTESVQEDPKKSRALVEELALRHSEMDQWETQWLRDQERYEEVTALLNMKFS